MKSLLYLLSLKAVLISPVSCGEALIESFDLANRRHVEIDLVKIIPKAETRKISEIVKINPPENFDKVFCLRIVKIDNLGELERSINFLLKNGRIELLLKKRDIEIDRNDKVIYLLE